MTFVLGFTGTRDGMTDAQELTVWECLKRWTPSELRHGDCCGADEQAHNLAVRERIRTVAHPPVVELLRAFCKADLILEPRDYLHRDRDIVDASKALLAAPATVAEGGWSGTWYTIRYARRRHVPVVIIGPDGRVIENE
jgi:hypothetical protein